MAIVLIAAGGL